MNISGTFEEASLDTVLEEARVVAREAGGDRAARAVSRDASLERDVGLGSLEKVELITRLERRTGRTFPDHALQADTCAGIAAAMAAAAQNEGSIQTATPREARTSAAAPRSERAEIDAPTIDRALAFRAERSPDQVTVFLTEDDGSERNITYRDLLDGAGALANGLAARGIRRGDRVALVLPTGFDFLRAFQGTILLGAICVPIYPPIRLDRLSEYAERQSAILRSAGVRVLVTIPRAKPIADILKALVPSLEAVVTADELAASGAGVPLTGPQARPKDPAFIQYTSGSTGAPKGVLLTHANLMANIRAIQWGLEAGDDEVGVSWLPLYHDMGLIGSWLFPMAAGFPLALRSPLSFLARPERWLQDIHRRRGTLSAAPNFAYELCVRRVRDEDIAGIDLSSWKCALNGAEPVRPDTLDRFIARFSKFGFRPGTMMPVYGLAESSVGLAFPPVGRGPKLDRVTRASFEEGHAKAADPGDDTPITFVSAGRALPEHAIRIVGENGEALPERRVGRLLFKGPSMTSGYFENPAATGAIAQPGGFLDSGDLAYFADGEIFITGRLKDLIIRGGRNFAAAEIEEAAAGVAGVRQGCVAAFGVTDERSGTEKIVVVAETKEQNQRERDAIESAIVERVGQAIGVPPDVVRLAPQGAIPKTSSGKIRRNDTRVLYTSGKLGREKGDTIKDRMRLAALITRTRLHGLLQRSALLLRGARLYAVLFAYLPFAAVALRLLSRSTARRFERASAKLALRLLTRDVRVEGSLTLTPGRPALLVCNHASYIDVIPLRALLPSDFVFVSKREALDYPVIGSFLRKSGHICVDRNDALKSAGDVAQVTEALSLGEHVLVFPEGTFTASDGLRSFRLGAFQSAGELKCPVIPLTLRGTRRMLRDGEKIPRRGAISLTIGPPLHADGDAFRDLVALRDKARAAIASTHDEVVLEGAQIVKAKS